MFGTTIAVVFCRPGPAIMAPVVSNDARNGTFPATVVPSCTPRHSFGSHPRVLCASATAGPSKGAICFPVPMCTAARSSRAQSRRIDQTTAITRVAMATEAMVTMTAVCVSVHGTSSLMMAVIGLMKADVPVSRRAAIVQLAR